METVDIKTISIAIDRQAKLLERIAIATDRSNELLYALLSPQQRESLGKAGTARLASSLSKPKT